MQPRHPDLNYDNVKKLYTEIAKSITGSLDITVIIENIMRQVYLYFKPLNWSLLRIDDKTNELYFVVAQGPGADKIQNMRFKLGEGVIGHVAVTGKSILVEDVNKSELFNKKADQLSGFTTKSIVAVPITFKGKVLGVIELINKLQENEFSIEDLDILQTIADFSAIALNNAIMHERINYLAIHDPLTDLYNRSFLTKFFSESENLMTLKTKMDLCTIAVLIDIDLFKEINDQYGHAAGDKVLIKLASLLKTLCHDNDYVFRVGGDEFLILLTRIDDNNIELTENYIIKKLKSFQEITRYYFNFSFGIATGKNINLEQLILIADKNMYKTKKTREIT